jgi:hypothetical protein
MTKTTFNVTFSDDSGCVVPQTTQKVVIVLDFDEVVREDLQASNA